jgi:hypothetical protein
MNFLKLCVISSFIALIGCAQTLAAESWAKQACQIIDSLPEASVSALPSGTKVVIEVTPSMASAAVLSPSGLTKHYQAQLRQP